MGKGGEGDSLLRFSFAGHECMQTFYQQRASTHCYKCETNPDYEIGNFFRVRIMPRCTSDHHDYYYANGKSADGPALQSQVWFI